MKKVIIFLFILSIVSSMQALASGPMIPTLNWEQRSDWTSVKTPKTWHRVIAKGDGKTDDTAALQMTMSTAAIKGGTVYLPPGRYRITSPLLMGTLQFDSRTRPEGFSIIGHGRDTVIVWDGPDGVPMLRMLGVLASRIIGVTFDAQNKASACVEMGGPGFQSHNMFRHCAFKNAVFAGIDSGRRGMNTAGTEMIIDNCLFENCGRGVSLCDFNDYDCVIEGSEFRDCGVGVYTFKGNFYCRNTHFERSRESDFKIHSEHTSTIRRCTSLNSKRFLIQDSPIVATVIQDCRIAGWRAKDAAVVNNSMPLLIFDTVFDGSSSSSPAIKFVRSLSENLVKTNRYPNSKFKFISSNNSFIDCPVFANGKNVTTYNIPCSGKYLTKNKLTAKTSFLKTKSKHAVWSPDPKVACIPGKVFDIKKFGAKGKGADDTAAFQKAIAAAKAHGRGAIAYIPHGYYRVSKTLKLDGDNWYFGGTGNQSKLAWFGPQDGTLLHVEPTGTLGVTGLYTVRANVGQKGIDILQTGGGADETLTIYDNVRVYGFLIIKPNIRGFVFKGLGENDKVISRRSFGNMRFVDSQQAEILINSHYEGCLSIEGKSKKRSGLTAVQFALLELCDPCVWVKDNNSFVMVDFYAEQHTSHLRLEGNGSDTRGRVSIGTIKTDGAPSHFRGYKGEVTLGTPQHYRDFNHFPTTKINNDSDCDIDYLEFGSYYYYLLPSWNKSPGFRPRFFGVGGGPTPKEMSISDFLKQYEDTKDKQAFDQASRFLDDMRRVGLLDLEINYGVK